MEQEQNSKTAAASRKAGRIALEFAAVAALLCGIAWLVVRFSHFGNVEFTDNASVRQDIVPVDARVQGLVVKVGFDEYQTVRKGDTLVVIEDAEYRLRLAQAEADYANARFGKSAMNATISTTRNNLDVSDAGIAEAEALLASARLEFERTQKLNAKNAATQQQLDNARAAYEAQKARHALLLRQKTSTSLVKDEQSLRLGQQQAGVSVAKAAVDLARLNLSHTVVVAPCDGVVGRKGIQEGQVARPGQTLFSIVDVSRKWVVANFRETQLRRVAVGLPADIEVDALPGAGLTGKVCAISEATGSQFSLIPQDNSAGNFVKVEQLVPVKICLDRTGSDSLFRGLRAGMSVEASVRY